jgi:hypothetical protein
MIESIYLEKYLYYPLNFSNLNYFFIVSSLLTLSMKKLLSLFSFSSWIFSRYFSPSSSESSLSSLIHFLLFLLNRFFALFSCSSFFFISGWGGFCLWSALPSCFSSSSIV